ncbi:MAG: 4Fe-4S binding protein [Methylobacter sp.]
MALAIDGKKCARCGACMPECPNEAIFKTEDSYVIDSTMCIECVGHGCEPMCEAVCSNDSIGKVKDGFLKKIFG